MKYFVLLNQIFGLQNDNIDGIIEKKQLKDMQNDEAKEFMTKLFHKIDNDKSGIDLFPAISRTVYFSPYGRRTFSTVKFIGSYIWVLSA